MIGHPREWRLLGFLDGRLPDGDRRRIAAHLAQCQRCRNVVQGHRTVRSVFQLEAPPAPGGVLERIVATRAGGGVVVLPVADPGQGRRVRGSVLALAAAAAAVMLLSLVQVVPVPMRPIADAWDWWSRTVVAWRPFAGGSGRVRMAEVLEAPIADPAVLHPERLRPMTATYRVVNRRGVEQRPEIATITVSLTPPAEHLGSWMLRIVGSIPPRWQYSVSLDQATLAPHRWGAGLVGAVDYEDPARGAWRRSERWSLTGDRIERTIEYSGEVPDPILKREPPGTRYSMITRSVSAPYYHGEHHFRIQMTTVDLHARWAGSFAALRVTSWEKPSVILESYYVDGAEVVTTPAGTFDTWRVRMVESYRESTVLFWFRKSDGLLVRQEHGPGNDYGTREELIAVSYP